MSQQEREHRIRTQDAASRRWRRAVSRVRRLAVHGGDLYRMAVYEAMMTLLGCAAFHMSSGMEVVLMRDMAMSAYRRVERAYSDESISFREYVRMMGLIHLIVDLCRCYVPLV